MDTYYVLHFINFLSDTGDFGVDFEVQPDEEDSNDLELPTGIELFNIWLILFATSVESIS